MNPATKTKIKNYTIKTLRFTGKYSLKGLGYGIEYATRGTAKLLNALTSTKIGRITLNSTAIIGASLIAPVYGGIIGGAALLALGIKLLKDNVISNKNKALDKEITEVLGTKTALTKLLETGLTGADRGMEKLGDTYQNKVDDWFK